jgi:hypothetical protein
VSLILEALKKLERDKQVPDRGGFLVMAARPWPSSDDAGRRLFLASLALAGFGVAGLAAAGAWWWGHRQASGHGAAQASVAPATAPVTATAAPASPVSVPASRAYVAAAVAPVPHIGTSPATVASAPKTDLAPARAPEPAGVAPAELSASTSAPVEVTAVEHPPAKKAPADLRLTAISERDGKRVAILNDRTVYEGDSFEGVTVIRIGENEIELDVNGRRRVIEF